MSAGIALELNRLQLSARRRHVTVILVLDRSHSMNAKYSPAGRLRGGVVKTRLRVAAEGACSVIEELESDDHAAVLAFSDKIDDVSGGAIELSSRNKMALKQRIMGLSTNGGTKLYDTILAATQIVFRGAAAAQLTERALGGASSAGGEHDLGSFWLVVLTDGEDTHSSNSLSDVVDVFTKLRALDPAIQVHTALIGVNLGSGPKRTMELMAHAGGPNTTFTDARDMSEVTQAFSEIRVQMSVQRTRVPIALAASSSGAGQAAWTDGPIPKGAHVRAIGFSKGAAGVSIGDVGVVKARTSDGQNYVVDFPRCDDWNAAPSDIVIDPEADRIRPGALVTVKDSVTDPLFGWGVYQRKMHGMVVKVDHDGKVLLELGLNPDASAGEGLWACQLRELQVADAGDFKGARRGHWPDSKLQLGMAVRVPSHLSEPSTQWGNLQRGEVGYVRGYRPFTDMYVCDFPSVDGWRGRGSDLTVDSVATMIRPGKFVRVRSSVSRPQRGWAGVTPSSVGRVLSCSHDGNVTVEFPEHPEWKGSLAELETVKAPGHTAQCDACRDGTSIQGSRFKCMNCHDYDLCRDCYEKGHHVMSHTFWRMDHRDSKPVELTKRSAPVRPTAPTPRPSSSSSYRGQGTSSAPTIPTASAFRVSPNADPIVVDAVPVGGANKTFSEGQQVRITGLVGDTDLNGECGSIFKSIGSDKYYVKFPKRDGKKMIIKSVNLESVISDQSPFALNSVVETVGLSNARENDKIGQVVGYDSERKRVVVKLLDEENRQLSLKAENLTLLEEAA